MLHRQGRNSSQHPIDAQTLIEQLKQQLDENIDRDCTPLGGCGASGVPFKVTCTAYGYTVVGKGTTSQRRKEVKREAVVYRVYSTKHRDLLFLFSWGQSIWPNFTTYMELARSATCSSWPGEVNIYLRLSMTRGHVRLQGPRRRFVRWGSCTRTSGWPIFCGMLSWDGP